MKTFIQYQCHGTYFLPQGGLLTSQWRLMDWYHHIAYHEGGGSVSVCKLGANMSDHAVQ
jgi:hypothetical protein